MDKSISKLTIKGFKSIRSLEDFPLRPLNILIGANGAGKSNFVSFFSFLHELVAGRLALTVNKGGGADAHLFLGPRVTKKISAELHFGLNGYLFELEPTVDNRLVFSAERVKYSGSQNTPAVNRSMGTGQSESKLSEQVQGGKSQTVARSICEAISGWVVYHFHDTRDTSPMRRPGTVRDNERLRPDGGNLAAFLFRLQEEEPSAFELICDTLRLVAPFFKEFRFRPRKLKGDELVQLDWLQKTSDYPLHPGQFSDGTLRFIALATALLQPEPPATILIDEPELGLHPYALNTLASLIRQARKQTQLIVSTQSAGLLNTFEPEDIVVIDRADFRPRGAGAMAGKSRCLFESPPGWQARPQRRGGRAPTRQEGHSGSPQAAIAPQLTAIREKFKTPEEINDSSRTAPSKRIEKLHPTYEKPLYGSIAASRIGIDTMLRECPHFQEWLTKLQSEK